MSGKRIYIVLGEESGDALGADLVEHWHGQGSGHDVMGLAGPRLEALGMESLFPIEDIAVMGFTAVAARLPSIVRRVYQTVADIKRAKPDVLLLIDSPDFTHAVAKRVRKAMPDLPIIDYVCPSVWAWRPGRARAMVAYIDHVLAILPFEPDILRDLGGPPASYVGHPLASKNLALAPEAPRSPPNLLLLPGSRRSEMERMEPLLRATAELLVARGCTATFTLSAVERLRPQLEERTAQWGVPVELVAAERNSETFANADAALACSGTVLLELAMQNVPTAMAYLMDPVARQVAHVITTWTGVLPNHITDQLLISEDVNEMARPERLARRAEALLQDGPVRRAQLDGFKLMRERMHREETAAAMAAAVIDRFATEGRAL